MDNSQEKISSAQVNVTRENTTPTVASGSGSGRKPVVKRYFRKWWLIVAGAIVLVGAAAGLLATGVVYVGVKAPAQKVVVQTRVCGEDIVNRYNAASKKSIMTDDTGDLSGIVNEIRRESDYQDDPTCWAIVFWYSVESNDQKGARQAFDRFSDLRSKSFFPNPDLINNNSTASMGATLNSLAAGSE